MRWLLAGSLVAVLGGGCVLGSADGPTLVRIENDSAYDYEDLLVNFEPYGTLAAGAVTDYRDFGVAYRYTRVDAVVDGEDLLILPIDFVGETPLGPGRFTYVVSVVDDGRSRNLTMVTVED